MKRKILQIVPIMLLIGVVFFVFNNFSCSNSEPSVFGNNSSSPLKGDQETARAIEIQDTFRKIYELYKDRVVFITTEQVVELPPNPFFDDPFFRQFFGIPEQKSRKQKRTGLGSGFVLSSDGYICTNYHVIANVDSVKVKVKNKEYKATIVGFDQRTDLALLKINSAEKLDPVFLGDSDQVKVGDWAIAIGNPFGLDRTFTVGVISATSRKDVDMMGGSQSHIQTDAAINPGNSGGPLVNINGEVIGINRMIYSQSGGYMGIGFAIPINTAKAILEQLKKYKKVKTGYIGVQIVPLTEEYANELGLKNTEGALVGGIMENSPAEKAGIQPGDVIISVDDKNIKSYEDLIEIVNKTPIGKTLKVGVWRNKQKIYLFVTVKERP